MYAIEGSAKPLQISVELGKFSNGLKLDRAAVMGAAGTLLTYTLMYGVPLNFPACRLEAHAGGMMGGCVYARYILVAPADAAADWEAKANEAVAHFTRDLEGE